MSKSVRAVKNSLKFKANVKEGILSVRVGVKKYVLPVSARILSNGDFLFLSFTASSELYKIKDKKLAAMGANDDATNAYTQLNPGRKRRRRASAVEMPSVLADALKKLPSGYRLGYDTSGQPRLVKTRVRAKRKK